MGQWLYAATRVRISIHLWTSEQMNGMKIDRHTATLIVLGSGHAPPDFFLNIIHFVQLHYAACHLLEFIVLLYDLQRIYLACNEEYHRCISMSRWDSSIMIQCYWVTVFSYVSVTEKGFDMHTFQDAATLRLAYKPRATRSIIVQ